MRKKERKKNEVDEQKKKKNENTVRDAVCRIQKREGVYNEGRYWAGMKYKESVES